MKIVKKETTVKETEIDIELPAYFKHDDKYYRYHEGKDWEVVDIIRVGEKMQSVSRDFMASVFTDGYEKGEQITEREFSDALMGLEVGIAASCRSIMNSIHEKTFAE